MANNNFQQAPFWDFIRSFDNNNNNNNNGAGVSYEDALRNHNSELPPYFAQSGTNFGQTGPHPGEHFGGFGPFGWGGHWGRGGHRGRGCHHRGEQPRDGHIGTAPPTCEQPDGETRDGSQHGSPHSPDFFGRRGRGGRRHGPGHHGYRGPPPPPSFGVPGGFDLSGLFESLAARPMAQAFRNYAEQAAGQQSGEAADVEDENNFTPPIDIFSTETQYVLHVALPGAKKEDVGINWDSEKGVLNLAGVVYRRGDEEFLKTICKSERKVGMFERAIKLPPGNEEKEEVDSDAITAKLEDGVLVVTVPKVEKEWTEVKRVDIE